MSEENKDHGGIKRDTGFLETIFVTLFVGLIGSIFIMGAFAWQEVQLEKQLNRKILVNSNQ